MQKLSILLLALFLTVSIGFSLAVNARAETHAKDTSESTDEENSGEQAEKAPVIKKAPPSTLRFIDEGKNNASFKAFRTELLARIAKKDVNYLNSIIDPEMKFNLGKGEDFIKFYRLDTSATRSSIWRELGTILKLGGVFTEEGFCAPYVTCAWPDDYPIQGYAAITGNKTLLKREPGDKSQTIATLNNNIVKTVFSSAALRSGGWVSIETLDGKKGFVRQDQVRAADDYRAFFKQKNGKWKLVVYISG